MNFGRDSWLWILAIAAAILTYLGAAEPPTQWHWDDSIRFAAFCVATLSGKLSQSPLPRGNQ
jgi:hypothetical protein